MKSGAGSRSAAQTAMSSLILLVCVLMSGCREAPTANWSAQARSPDGTWLAIARSEQGGGIGGAYDVTTVSLRRFNGSQPPAQVLLFSHEYATMNLKMEWLTPTRLNVTYGPSARPGDHVDLNFQAVKCAGVEISVRDLSNGTMSSSQ
jgi:hypothetical protein